MVAGLHPHCLLLYSELCVPFCTHFCLYPLYIYPTYTLGEWNRVAGRPYIARVGHVVPHGHYLRPLQKISAFAPSFPSSGARGTPISFCPGSLYIMAPVFSKPKVCHDCSRSFKYLQDSSCGKCQALDLAGKDKEAIKLAKVRSIAQCTTCPALIRVPVYGSQALPQCVLCGLTYRFLDEDFCATCNKKEGNDCMSFMLPVYPCIPSYESVSAPSTPKAPAPKTKFRSIQSRQGSKTVETIILSSDLEPESDPNESDSEPEKGSFSERVAFHKANASKERLNREKPKPAKYPTTALFAKLKKDSNVRRKNPTAIARYLVRCELKLQDQSGKVTGTRCSDQTHGFAPEDVSTAGFVLVKFCSQRLSADSRRRFCLVH